MDPAMITEGVAFSVTSMVMAVVLYAVAIAMNAAARTNTQRKTVRLKKLTRDLTQECETLAAQVGEVTGAVKKLEAEEKALSVEVVQLRKAVAAAQQDTFQVVHEVGTPTPGAIRMDVEIVLSPAAMNEGPATAQNDPRVWAWRNVAQIWAATPADALQAAARTFPPRYGFVVTKILNREFQDVAAP